jgi:hypothetical protein
MKKLLLSLATLVLTSSLRAQNNDWQSLFDGKTTNGWHLFKKPGVTPAWKVQDDAIYLDVNGPKDGRGDLVTDKEFGDFEFEFEWKVAPASNSGVIFFVQESDKFSATWHTGPEYQVIDNTGYPDKLKPVQLSASLYDMIPCPAEYVKPTGEWNKTTISFIKGKLEFIVNGKKPVSITLGSEEWNKLISGSKFVDMKDFAKNTKGHIALQDHGGAVWFKNLRIKSIN